MDVSYYDDNLSMRRKRERERCDEMRFKSSPWVKRRCKTSSECNTTIMSIYDFNKKCITTRKTMYSCFSINKRDENLMRIGNEKFESVAFVCIIILKKDYFPCFIFCK